MNREAIPAISFESAFYGFSGDDIRNWLKKLGKEIEFEDDFEHISRRELIELVTSLYDDEKYHGVIHERIKREVPEKCGIGPTDTEKILECTTTERKRWRSEGRLIVVDEFNTGSKRYPVWVPMYDRTQLESLTEEDIERWREEWKEEKKKKRKLKEEYKQIVPDYVVIQACKKERTEYTKGPIGYYDEKELKQIIKEQTEVAKCYLRDNFYVIIKKYSNNEILHIKKVR